MTKQQSQNNRNFERSQSLFENIFHRLSVLLAPFSLGIDASLVRADGDSSDLLEQTRVEQVRQHPVKPKRNFIQILQKQNLVFEARLIRSCQRCADQRKVAAD